MISGIRPMLNSQVEHWLPPVRDIHGRETKAGSTSHYARLIYSPGRSVGPASREKMADAAAIIWLLDHPRAVEIGDSFELPDGKILTAIRVEHRFMGMDTLIKVYLS